MASDETPLIAGRIHGIRVWMIELGDGSASLHGVTAKGWVPGGRPTVASCSYGNTGPGRRGHRSPDPDCGCGLYAVHPHAAQTALAYLGGASGQLYAVAGIVEAWGRVEVHEAGFRAEFARPTVIAAAGVRPDSDTGEILARLARRYRAELVAVDDPHDLVAYCRDRDMGLSRQVVRSLVPKQPRARTERVPSISPQWRSRLGEWWSRLGEWVCMGLLGLAALLWYGFVAFVGVSILIGVINGDFGSSGEPFSARKLRVVDQALVWTDDGLRYVAIVRNTSEKRVALAAFARGKVLDGAGEQVVRLGARGKSDWRPTLLPGETGVVVDEFDRTPGLVPASLRFETEIVARRQATENAKPPVVLGDPALDHGRCRLSVAVEAGRAARGAGVTIVARDAAGEISGAGPVALGRAAVERGRWVMPLGEPGDCPGWLRAVETYPFIFPAHAAG